MNNPVLRREMGAVGGLLITLSCLSPGIGVFIVGSDVIGQAGSGAFCCFVAAVLLGVAMAAVYAELGSAFPNAGGEYTMTGIVLGPTAGFAILANNLLGLCIALALSGTGVAEYLSAALGDLPARPVALVTILSVTTIGVLSIRANAWVTGVFLAGEVAALLLTAALGFRHASAATLGRVLHPAAGVPLHAVPASALGVAAVGAIYAFNGYGSAAVFGEEMRDPRRSVAAVIYGALGAAALTELLPMAGVIAGAPDLGALSASPAPVAGFLRWAGGAAVSCAVSLAVAAAIFNAMIGIVLVGGRQIYATARDRGLPGGLDTLLDRIHPRFGSPWAATLALGGAGALCCALPAHLLVTILGNGNVALYALLCVAVIEGRRDRSTSAASAPMPLYPLPPLVVLAALCGVVWADLLDAEGRTGLAVTALVLASGAGYYRLVLKRRAGWSPRASPEAPDGDLA